LDRFSLFLAIFPRFHLRNLKIGSTLQNRHR
jgi:hypothetical protein